MWKKNTPFLYGEAPGRGGRRRQQAGAATVRSVAVGCRRRGQECSSASVRLLLSTNSCAVPTALPFAFGPLPQTWSSRMRWSGPA